ncbi:MAG: ATP-binding protein [Spirochaetota bacterium]
MTSNDSLDLTEKKFFTKIFILFFFLILFALLIAYYFFDSYSENNQLEYMLIENKYILEKLEKSSKNTPKNEQTKQNLKEQLTKLQQNQKKMALTIEKNLEIIYPIFLTSEATFQRLYQVSEKVFNQQPTDPSSVLRFQKIKTKLLQKYDKLLFAIKNNIMCKVVFYYIVLTCIACYCILGLSFILFYVIKPVFKQLHKQNQIKEELNEINSEIINIKQTLDAGMIVAKTNPQGIITYVNNNFCKLSGYQRSEILGQNYSFISSNYHEKAFFQELWNTVKSGSIWRGEIKNKSRDGSFYWLDTFIKPVYYKDQGIYQFYSIANEITDRKSIEENLERANKEAEKANLSKSAFIANISHEIRTPLNAIIGFSDLLKQSITSSKETQYLNSIISSGAILLELIQDLIDLSKLEAGMISLETNFFPLMNIIRPLEDFFANHTNHKPIQLKVDLQSNLPKQIYSDQNKILQILRNLLANAIKFTSEGTITLQIRSNFQNSQLLEKITFSIIDSGIGVSEQELNHIFELFHRGIGKNEHKYQGIGLGLTICQKLTHMLGAKITCTSELETGSTFCLDLGKVRCSAEKLTQPTQTPHKQQKILPAGKRTVLIADDFELNRILLKNFLGEEYNLVQVDNGRDLLEKAQQLLPDIILTDYNMPELNGEEVARKLEMIPSTKQIPIVLLTSQKEMLQQKTNFFTKVLLRPLKKTKLLEVVHALLGKQYVAKTSSLELQHQLQELLPEWNSLKNNLHFVKIAEFGTSVQSLGTKYQDSSLENYGLELTDLANNFNASLLPEKLKDFEQYLDNS